MIKVASKLIIASFFTVFSFNSIVADGSNSRFDKYDFKVKRKSEKIENKFLKIKGKTRKYYPVEKADVLNNPYMGFAPRANKISYNQEHDLVYAKILWSEIEPEKDVFRFDLFESEYNFDYWQSKNAKFIIRVVMDEPKSYSHMDIPNWLYHEINEDGIWYDTEYGKGFSPNYSNNVLINYHNKLIEKLSKRYNDNSKVAFIQLGSLGHWGEWHTSHDIIPFPTQNITDKYVQHYINNFTNVKQLMRRPYEIAKNNDIGLFNDMIGSERHTNAFIDWFTNGYESWLTGEIHPSMPNFWQNAPSGGEFSNSYMEEAIGSNFDYLLSSVEDTHLSWIGPGSPIDYDIGCPVQDNINKLKNTLGYRFVIESAETDFQVKKGSETDIKINWINKGVAPFYYNWPVEIVLSDYKGEFALKYNSSLDITKVLPNELYSNTDTLKIPKDIKFGLYNILVSVNEPKNNIPGIEFAIGGEIANKRYKIGNIFVK